MSLRVPFRGEEKESLQVALQRHRDVLVWKVQGLDDEQLRRKLVPSGTTLLGLIKHMAAVEYGWFLETFDRPVDDEFALDSNDDTEADLRIEPTDTTQGVLEFYARACAAADDVINELPLDAAGKAWWGEPVSMRWVLIHMVEETARHAGHMDILRELIDGEIGDHDRS